MNASTGTLVVRTTHPLSAIARMHPIARVLRSGIRIAIDGTVVSRETEVTLPLPVGEHRLEVWMRWMLLRTAQATAVIEIVPGETLIARYSAPEGVGVFQFGAELPRAELR